MNTVLLTLALLMPAADVPPSPAEAPGIKIWPVPAFTVWPAVIHPGEVRHGVVTLPVRIAGGRTDLLWEGRTVSVPFPCADGWTLGKEPPGTPTVGALVELPATPGVFTATVATGKADLRVVRAGDTWPQSNLRDGLAVDDGGTPIVILAPRHDDVAERRFRLLNDRAQRPAGPPILLGDDLDGALAELPGVCVIARRDHRGASHPALVAAAHAFTNLPPARSLCWSPGPVIFTAPAEEDRVLDAIGTHFRALGQAPDRILLLPEGRPGHQDEPRRQELAQAAAARGWKVVTVEHFAGTNANRLADGVWAAGPTGEARLRLRQGLAALLTAP